MDTAIERYHPGNNMRNMKLAHAYIPFQKYTENYPPETALNRGTLYPELWMPYNSSHRGYY